MTSDDKIPCPYCGEPNVRGSNVCARCMRHIRHVANPEVEDFIETVQTRPPRVGWLKRMRHWIRGRDRRVGARRDGEEDER